MTYFGYYQKDYSMESGSVINIPASHSKKELMRFLQLSFEIEEKNMIFDSWQTITSLFDNKLELLELRHEGISKLEPTWDIAEYLSVLYNYIRVRAEKRKQINVRFLFNINEKDIIDMYFPADSVEDGNRQIQSLLQKKQYKKEDSDNVMTREVLQQKLTDLGIPETEYSLWDELKPMSIVLYHNYYKWEVFYLDERGGRNMLNICFSEDEACRFIYERILKTMT